MREFYSNRECWFVGDFSTHAGEASLDQARSVISLQALSLLRKRPKAVLIGPGTEVFGRNGHRSLPEKPDGCHVIVLLGACAAQLRVEVAEYAQRHGVPLLEHTATADLVECYFVPSAWEAKRLALSR